MPSIVHETIIQLLRENGVLVDLLRRVRGLELGAVAPADPNFSETKPVEWRGDAFFVGGDPKDPERWLGLEVQASVDEDKLRTIPLSLELARDRHRNARGDVVLVTVGETVARWFDRHPFIDEGPLGTRRTLEVIRIDLSRVPESDLLDERRPFLAPLAVAAHAKSPKARSVAQRALGVARQGGGAMAPSIVDAILQMTDAQVRRELEVVMQREGYRTEWLQESYLKGKAEGRANGIREALLHVLARRGLALDAEAQARIEAESDLQRLQRWHDVAVTAKSVSEVFADDA